MSFHSLEPSHFPSPDDHATDGTVHCLEGRCLKNAKKFPLHPYPDGMFSLNEACYALNFV